MVDIVQDKSTGDREVPFSFCAVDLSGGYVYAQLLILIGVRLVLGWSSGPICERVMSEGLEVNISFPGGAEESVPVSLIQNGNDTASTAHTLMSGDFGDVEQYWGCGDVISSSDVIWGRLSHESVQNVLGETGREMPGHVVGIVRVGAWFAVCHSDAGLAEGPGRFEGRSRYNRLSPRGGPSC